MISKGKRNLKYIAALLVQIFLSKWRGFSFFGDSFSAVVRGRKWCCLLFLAGGLACGIVLQVDLECNIQLLIQVSCRTLW